MPSTSHQALATTLASTAGAVQAQQEVLVFLDLAAAARLHRDDGRAAGREREARRSGQRRRAARAGAAALAAPAFGAGFQSLRTVAVQRVPGPSGSRKS